MRSFIATAGLVAGASAAAVARGDSKCCFMLNASGGVSGPISQLSDGQNRVGGSNAPATYCIDNGAITDASGRGCILTPPTTQFQCDTGATPTSGFSISSSGEVEYNGSTTFYACPATNGGMYNIYTKPVDNQPKCVKIELGTGGKCIPQKPMSTCPPPSTMTVTEKGMDYTVTKTEMGSPSTVTVTEKETCPAPSTVTVSDCATSVAPPPPPPTTVVYTTSYEKTTLAPPTTKESPPPTKPTGSSCPTSLTGPYQTPHLIVPVSSDKPDQAYGTQYNATITSTECTIFNFDVPQEYQGKSCSMIFLFPEQSQLQTSSYDISGSGSMMFSSLMSPADQQTTWNNCPAKKSDLGSCEPMPGNSYSISTSECSAGTTQSVKVCATDSLMLSFFEDYNPSPIGVYMTAC